MGATYTRQSSYTDGDVITAAHTNDEFNQLLAAFQASTGHTHDGTANEGGPITKMLGTSLTLGDGTAATDITVTFDGETNDGVLKWMEDEDYFEFSDDILVASTEKLQFRDTALYINSSADGQLDIVADTEVQIAAPTIDINGDADVSGTLTYGSLSDGSITITAFVDEDNMVSNSATLVPTQQSVKAYVDAQVTAQDLDFQADTGGALNIDLDSETLTLTGGTGIDTSGSGNAVTFAIDSTVATLAGTQTLTNKTLTTPVISTISNTGSLTLPTSTDTLVGRATTDTLTNKTLTTPIISSISNTGTLTLPTSTDTLVGRATTDTLTNKTINADNNTVSNIEVDNFKGTAIVTEAEGIGSSDNDTSLPTSAAVKDYVDTQITAEDLDITTDSGTIAIDLDSETLTIAGTASEIETSATGNTVTIGLPDSVTIKQLTLNPDTNVGKVLALEVQQGDVFRFGDTELYQDRTSGVHYIVNPTAAAILNVGGDSTIISDSTRQKAISRFDFSGGNGTSYIGYYDSTTGYSAKLTTSNTGATINGTATATTFSGDLNGTINSATTATTQTSGTNNTLVATTAFAVTEANNSAVAMAIALG